MEIALEKAGAVDEFGNAKFSLRTPVEETKDLVAVHNLWEGDLLKSLKLGGLPMPSIAIIKAESGHAEYGDISLVFRKDTIDPKSNKKNKVYGGDAWTPTYPTIEYKVNEKIDEKISKLYYDFARKYGYDEARPLYKLVEELEDELNRNNGEAGLIDSYKDDTRLMNFYLMSEGKGKVEPITREVRNEMSEAEIEQSKYLIQALGEDIINELKIDNGESPMVRRKAYFEKNGEKIVSAYKSLMSEVYGFSDEQIENVLNQNRMLDYIRMMNKAYKYLHGDTVSIEIKEDTVATDEAIKEAAGEDYTKWLNDLLKGVEEKSGIRNNVELFTYSGNRRSWEALHWENNLENVVRVMSSEVETGGGSLFSGLGIWGVSAKQYNSIEEVKADSDRLTKIDEGEYKTIKENFGERLNEIGFTIMDKTEQNQFIALDNAQECIVEAVRNAKTKSGILNNLKQYPQLNNVTETTVDDIVSLVTDISNMPTEYFEAKPQRAVDFNEVAYAVVPNNVSEELRTALTNANVPYVEYEADNESARLEALNSDSSVKFSRRDYTFSKALTSEEWKKYNNSMTTGVDAGLRINDNSTLVECEHGDFEYKYVIYDNEVEEKQILAVYGIRTNYDRATTREIAEYLYDLEEQNYADERVAKKIYNRIAENYSALLGKYDRENSRFVRSRRWNIGIGEVNGEGTSGEGVSEGVKYSRRDQFAREVKV